MHEFSIVQNIVDIAVQSATVHNVDHVYAVEVEVGQASGVVRDALDFAWSAAIKGTLLENAVLKIQEIPLVLLCRGCQNQYRSAEIYESCPTCGEINPEIISGKELKVIAIET